MATIIQRKQGNGVTYQVKVRLKGFPGQTATFTRKTDAARWASATETHLRETRHFPRGDAARHNTERYAARSPDSATVCERHWSALAAYR